MFKLQKLLLIVGLIVKTSFILPNKTQILTSIPPQTYIVKKLLSGFNTYNLESIIKKGENPEFFRPKPSLLKKISKADIYFSISIPFEKLYINKFSSKTRIVDTSINTNFLYIGKKHKLNQDPHIWLSPNSLKKQIIIITKTLLSAFKTEKKLINKNKADLIKDLSTNINKAKTLLAQYRGKSILVFHPAFSYYFHFFGLKQISIQKGHKISYKILNNLPDIVKRENIKRLFIQDTKQKQQIKNIAKKLKLKIVTLKSIPENPIKNIIDIAKTIKGINND